MSTDPSARMLASIPLISRNRPAVFPVQDVNLAMLLAQIRHRDAAGNLQPVRVIGHGAERVPTGQPPSTMSASVWLPSLHVECIEDRRDSLEARTDKLLFFSAATTCARLRN
jgi:hypothetical protein